LKPTPEAPLTAYKVGKDIYKLKICHKRCSKCGIWRMQRLGGYTRYPRPKSRRSGSPIYPGYRYPYGPYWSIKRRAGNKRRVNPGGFGGGNWLGQPFIFRNTVSWPEP